MNCDVDDRSNSPPPLPIPPRIHTEYTEHKGHTRSPSLPRTPTLSSTLRSSAGALRARIPVRPAVPSPPVLSVDSQLTSPLDNPSNRPNLAAETITWASWDTLSHRRVLIIGYPTGIQIWDCTDLSSVTEILNLSQQQWSIDNIRFNTFACAAILGNPHRPVLGVLLSASAHNHSALFIYSLTTHEIIHRIIIPGTASTFESNHQFIVISTTIVHILSASTFNTLWTTPLSSHPSTPVFAFSGRLLAYASPSPRRQSRPTSISSAVSVSPLSSLSLTNDFGTAARTVLTGVKMAYEAAKNKATSSSSGPVSRSAPADERPFVPTTPEDKDKIVATPHTNNPIQETGFYVTVLDLQPLLSSESKQPLKVAEFRASNSQPISRLAFSKDGCKLICVPENGQVTRVFRLCPRDILNEDGALRLYNLRRGRTSVVVEGLESSLDGRWIAIGTKNRTVHVFPTNPFGGPPDISGHLHGKIQNIDQLQSDSIEVAPLVRLRSSRQQEPEHLPAPLAFAFIHPGDSHRMPTGLLPRSRNVQDMLVFDPADGSLSLRRILIDQRPKDQLGLAAARVAVSRSLPGPLGTYPAGSPGSMSSNAPSPTTEVTMELVGRSELLASWNLQRNKDWKELRKTVDEWDEHERSYGPDWLAQAELSTCSRSPRILPRSIYLSHQFTFWTFGEDYHALLRQYQFNVRGSKINVRRQVQVSIGVGLNQTSDRFVEDMLGGGDRPAHGGSGASFDEPLASALSGDLVADSSYIPTILPMYPNGGISGTKTPAFIRNPIPIRKIGDGMSEGLGRIRREISSSYQKNKLRSPSLGPRREGVNDDVITSVPLEFDEEDEDFLGVSRGAAAVATGVSADSGTTGTSSSASGCGIDVAPPTPDSEQQPTRGLDDEELWKGWESREVGDMVESLERFDDISVLGLLDEEHQREKTREREIAAVQTNTGIGKKRRKKGGR